MKIEITIKNGQSLKLRQKQQVGVSFICYKHTTDRQHFTQPIRGVKGELTMGREGVKWVGRREEAEGVPGKHNQTTTHPYHLIPHPHP
jgi:hypothetical protein